MRSSAPDMAGISSTQLSRRVAACLGCIRITADADEGRHHPSTMSPKQKDAILTAAILFAAWIGLMSGWTWWHDHLVPRFDRPRYAMLPVVNVLVALAIGAAFGWLWSRSVSRYNGAYDRDEAVLDVR